MTLTTTTDTGSLTQADAQKVTFMTTTFTVGRQALFSSLDDAEAFLRAAFAGWFVYRGGHHVSLHRASGQPQVLMIAEARKRNRRRSVKYADLRTILDYLART